MAQQNIYNPSTKQFGYQVAGAATPAGWISVNSPAPAPAPVPAVAPTPNTPTSDNGVRRYTGANIVGTSPYDTQAASYFSGLNYNQPDEAKIRSDALSAVQAQIDNVKNTYAGMLAAEETRGVDRLGRTRAVNARSGLVGSNFGSANLDKTAAINAQNEQAIQEEQAQKVDTILAGVNQDVQTRVQNEKANVDKNTTEHLAYLKDLGDRATQQISQLAGAGFTIDKLTDQEYNHLLDATGLTPEQLKAQFALNAPKATVLHSEVQGNKYIQVTQDPVTKKTTVNTIDLGFEVPKDYSVQKLDNGQLVFYPTKPDPSKPLSSQIMTYGVPTNGSTKPQTSGSLTYTPNDISQGASILNASKNQGPEADGNYVDPNLYKKMYDTWVAGGGLPQDFIKNYPPSIYVNPANTTLPQNLRSKDIFSADTGGGA